MAVNWKWFEDQNKRRFINPYNFVSLGSEVERTEPTDGTLTGKIKVSLIVKTPLAIPDAEKCTTDSIGHKTFPFFRVGDKPVIPGSQLRGMIRNAYETLSNSCFSVNNNNILSARHTNPGNPGLIQYRDGAWHLYEAQAAKDRGQDINPETEARRTWYMLRTEGVKTKIFHSTGKEIECVNLEKAVQNYEDNIKIYEADGSKFKKYKARITYGIRKDHALYPVFYEIVEYNGENYAYLSPSQFGRYVFDNRLDNLLGSHMSCAKHKGECLCKACALFGMIGDGGRRAYASKLRFSDAQFSVFSSMGKVMLQELAGPKPTAVEFYTCRSNGSLYWTYDYRITSYKHVNTGVDRNGRKQMQDVPQKEKYEVEIRGRKFYHHHPELKRSDYQAKEKTKRNSTMELCEPESRFAFDIYFEKITEQQLQELLWTITIGENCEESKQMYKLGHGKPLGLGSVKLIVDEIEMRSFDAETLSYQIEHIGSEQVNAMITDIPFDAESKPFAEFMQLSRFDGLASIMKEKKADISYPVADNGENKKNSQASHQWFIGNRSMGENGTTTSWSIKYALPEATSQDPTLPALKREQDNNKREYNQWNYNFKKRR